MFERHRTKAYRLSLIAILLASIGCFCRGVYAGPIPRLDTRTANSAAKISIETLAVKSRGEVGLGQMENAVESFRQGKFDQSLASFVEAHQQNAALPPPRVMLARLFLATGNGAPAKSLMEQAAIDHPSSDDVFLLFGEIARVEGRFSDALLNFEKAKALAAANASSHDLFIEATLGVASVFEARRQWEQADSYLREAVKTGADAAPVYIRLARVHFALKNYENAEKLLRRAQEKAPESDPFEIILGQWFHVDGQGDEAQRWLQAALEKYPTDPRVLVAATLWAIEVEQYEQATVFVDRLSKSTSGDPNVDRMQGIVARFVGDFPAAETAFQRLVTENPGDFAASNQLALVLLQQDVPDKQRRAMQLAELNYRQYPRAVDARATLGWVYFSQGRVADAETLFASIVPPEQVVGDSAYYAAKFHHERGRSDIARSLLTAAIAGPGAFTQRRAAVELLEDLNSDKSSVSPEKSASPITEIGRESQPTVK